MNNCKLSLKNFSAYRSTKCVIKDLSFQFNTQEIIALVGINGIGKSTLLQGMAGLAKTTGEMAIDNEDFLSMSRLKRAQKLTLLLQSSPLHPYCLAYSRIAQGLIPHFGFSTSLTKESQDLIEHCAQSLRITHLLKRPLAKMSGGELRLVNIAKCLVNLKTSVILLDEPSVFLDFIEKANLAKMLKQRAQTGSVIVFSSHDKSLIEACASRVLYIDKDSANLYSVANFFKEHH